LPSANILNLEARINAITPDTLTKVANKYLINKNLIRALMMPEK